MKRVGFAFALIMFCAGSALADFKAGLAAYNAKDFAKAVSIWKEDAAKGDLNAQYNLGILFETGVQGFPKDLASAFGWYRLAASQEAEAAQKALDRIKPLLTAGQIETGNNQAIEYYGKWFRHNIGRDEQKYQAARAALQADRQAKIEIERKAAAARAQRQRDLTAQRDADAKLADSLQRESRQAAVKAAQEKAEEAKRQAFIAQRRKEEAERLAALREEKDKQDKVAAARKRLAELQAKQRGSLPAQPTDLKAEQKAPAPTPETASAATVSAVPIAKPATKAEAAPKAAPTPIITSEPIVAPATKTAPTPKVVAAPKAAPAPKKESAPKVATAPTVAKAPEIEPAPKAVPAPITSPASVPAPSPAVPAQKTENQESVKQTVQASSETAPETAPETATKMPVAEAPKEVEVPPTPEPQSVATAAPVAKKPAESVDKAAAIKPDPKPAPVEPVAVNKDEASSQPLKATAAPTTAVVASKPDDKQKVGLPVYTNGLDLQVLQEIVKKANSVPLDTAEAKPEIAKGRTDIQALQWSLISAARGKGSAKIMTDILEKNMTPIQIAEANRLAAEWINQRQKRQ